VLALLNVQILIYYLLLTIIYYLTIKAFSFNDSSAFLLSIRLNRK